MPNNSGRKSAQQLLSRHASKTRPNWAPNGQEKRQEAGRNVGCLGHGQGGDNMPARLQIHDSRGGGPLSSTLRTADRAH